MYTVGVHCAYNTIEEGRKKVKEEKDDIYSKRMSGTVYYIVKCNL